MKREVTDDDGTAWNCVQAFAGLGDGAARARAAQVKGADGRVHVICTPSGGARSVRVELPESWEDQVPDDQLLAIIGTQQAEDR